MTHSERTGEREFRVPITEALPGFPFRSAGELVIRTAGDRPASVALRFFPSEAEFMARLPKLVEGTPLAPRVFDLGLAAAKGQAVVNFEAAAEVVEAVPAGLADLPTLEDYLRGAPPLFDAGRYALASVEFELKP